MSKGQRTGRVPHIKPDQLDDAWEGKIAPPVTYNREFQIVLAALKRNGEVYTGLVTASLGLDVRATGALLGSMVKQQLIKEVEKRRINGKSVQIYIGFNDKAPPKVKHDTRRPMCEILAEVEEMAEASDICELMVAKAMSIAPRLARDYISRLTQQKVLQKNGKKYIDGTWQDMYTIYVAPPKQQSMMSAPAVRDFFVRALFGDEVRDPEAAWVF